MMSKFLFKWFYKFMNQNSYKKAPHKAGPLDERIGSNLVWQFPSNKHENNPNGDR